MLQGFATNKQCNTSLADSRKTYKKTQKQETRNKMVTLEQ